MEAGSEDGDPQWNAGGTDGWVPLDGMGARRVQTATGQ